MKHYTVQAFAPDVYDQQDRALLSPCEERACNRPASHDDWHIGPDPERLGCVVMWPRSEVWRIVTLVGTVSP